MLLARVFLFVSSFLSESLRGRREILSFLEDASQFHSPDEPSREFHPALCKQHPGDKKFFSFKLCHFLFMIIPFSTQKKFSGLRKKS
jgi:hypothetical protein